MTFRLRRGKIGIEMRLHSLEAAIMDAVWSRKLRDFSVNDVLQVLRRERDIAYTTVMTTVARLHDKGMLNRVRDGRRYLYSALHTREQFLAATARHVLDQAVAQPQAMALLAERLAEASASDLDELEALIQRRREELVG